MMVVATFVLLLISLSAFSEAQQVYPVVDDSVYQLAYGQYGFYNLQNIPFTKYMFCISNMNQCKASSFSNYCHTYDTTCNLKTRPEANNIYEMYSDVYCRAWCNRCSGEHSLVCPAAPPVVPTGKCEYTKFTSFTTKVFNGQPTFQCQNPWSVTLLPNNVYRGYQFGLPPICQGVLIDDRTVITTMECISQLEMATKTPFHYNVTLGEYIWTYHEQQEEMVTATLDITNPSSTGVAKLTLDKPIAKFSKCVAPACLKSKVAAAQIDRTNCRITGWGSTSDEHVSRAPILRTGKVVVSTDEQCSGILSFLQSVPQPEIHLSYNNKKDVGCTTVAASESSACLGDEGGAVTCAEKTTGDQILVGLVKTGGCSKFNGTFFANVTSLF